MSIFISMFEFNAIKIKKIVLMFALLFIMTNSQEFLQSVTNSNFDMENTIHFSEKKILKGHKLGVTSLVELKNNFIASGSLDGTIKIWSIESGRESLITTLTGHADIVTSLAYLKNEILASGSRDGTIKLWDIKNNFNLIQTLSGHKGGVTSLIQLSSGQLISGSDDFSIIIWDTQENFKLLKRITYHILASISSLLQLSNGNLAAADKGYRIYIFEVILNGDYDLKLIYTLEHVSLISDLVELKNNMLASSSYDGSVRIWDISNGFGLVKKLYGKQGEVTSLVELNKRYLVSANTYYPTNPIVIWDTNMDFEKKATFPSGHDGYVNSMVQLSNGLIATASSDWTIKLWSVEEEGTKTKFCLTQLE